MAELMQAQRVYTILILAVVLYCAECNGRQQNLYTIVNARISEKVMINCGDDLEPGALVSWYKNGKALTENADIRFNNGIVKINNVRSEDQGVYSCVAVYGFAGAQPWKNFTLLVYSENTSSFPENPILESITEKPTAPPMFVEYPPGPRQMELNVGASPKLKCRVEANPHANITWYKNGREMSRMRGDIVKDGYTLKFNTLARSDEGRYICRVYNEYGSVNFTYTLVVIDPSVPTAKVIPPYPLNTSVTFGSAASLQCKVRSNSRPTIMWLKQVARKLDGMSTMDIQGKIYTIIKNETMVVETEEGAYLNKLIIPNVRIEDAGIYVCLGLNQGGGSDIRKALLTVIHPPVKETTTLFPALSDSSWEYIFGSPSATLAVLIAIPVVIILIITIAIIYTLNKKKKNTSIRRPPSSMMSDHQASAPLNMNANNGCYSGNGQYVNGSTGSYSKVPVSAGEHRYSDKLYQPATYKSGVPPPQQYSQYFQSDGSYRSSLHYPALIPAAALHHQQQNYTVDIPDTCSESHFSSVSHTRPQYMNSSRNPYDDRDIHSDPPASRVGGHHCPPPPPGSYYSEQW